MKKLILLFISFLFLVACGQTGSLYLPDESPENASQSESGTG